jgi:hypothetical protein
MESPELFPQRKSGCISFGCADLAPLDGVLALDGPDAHQARPPRNLAALFGYVGRVSRGSFVARDSLTMCDGAKLLEMWRGLVKRPLWQRLRKEKPRIRQLRNGSFAVVDGYGWGVEFATFRTRKCAELFIAEGFFHR